MITTGQAHSNMTAARAGSIFESSPQEVVGGPEPIGVRLHDDRQSGDRLGQSTFFRLRFAVDAGQSDDPTIVGVPLRSLGGTKAWEYWVGPQPVEFNLVGGIGFVAAGDHVAVHARKVVGPETDIEAATFAVYRELLQRVAELRYPYLVRIWNVVPEINGGSEDEEVYARFNLGRAMAFDQLGLQPHQYPAATGVGGPAGSPLTVIMLASRSEPFAIENPRQVSAYRYPRQYGPRSPAFARAMLLPERAGGILFISGTASIVGHESLHADIDSQLQETLVNLDELMVAAAARLPGAALGPRRSWRVYLRDPADLEHVEPEVTRRLGDRESVVFLQADICRRELRVEIEGVCQLTTAGTQSRP